jgi:DMSO/TMAO reductase YedYZ heme-binding membrane subunit
VIKAIGTHASRIILGLFVALVLVVALKPEPNPEATTLALIGATLALMVGEIYAHLVEEEIVTRRRPGWREIARETAEQSYIALGAAPAIILFGLAWAGAIEESTAIDISAWGGLGLLTWLGFLAAQATGRSTRAAFAHAAVLALLGAMIVAAKVLQHH